MKAALAITIQIDSFPPSFIRERSKLLDAVPAGDTILNIGSSAGFAADDIVYIGILGRERCERAVVESAGSASTISLASALGLAHAVAEPVTKVMGDKIRIYCAPNLDGSVPTSDQFTLLATRDIDAYNLSTYFRDPSGSSDYWYCTPTTTRRRSKRRRHQSRPAVTTSTT